jgi:hypothetical protein
MYLNGEKNFLLAALDEDIICSKSTKDSAVNAPIVVTGNEQMCLRWVI